MPGRTQRETESFPVEAAKISRHDALRSTFRASDIGSYYPIGGFQMSERLRDEFDEFVGDCQTETGRERTLEEIIRQSPRVPSPSELLARANEERERKMAVSPFERFLQVEEAVSQQRIAQIIQGPEFKKSAAGPAFTTEAKPEPGDLSWAVGGLEQDEPPPAIVGAPPNSGRAPGSSFTKSHGSTRGSILDRPFDELMELVGERASTPGARSLAKSLAQEARESGGGL